MEQESSPDSRSISKELSSFLLVGAVAFFGALVFLGRQAFFSEGAWSTGGDLLWFQGWAQLASDEGPFSGTLSLGWPDGVFAWSHPQAGLLLMSFFWFFGGVIGVSSAATLSWSLASIAALNAVAILYFLRRVSSRISLLSISLTLAVALALSPFSLLKMGHINVATFFILPAVLGLLLRMRDTGSTRMLWRFVPAFAILAFLSPMWWVVVALFLLGIVLVFGLLAGQKELARNTFVAILSSLVGFAGQAVLFVTAPGSDAVTRGPWESNVYGGRAVDFLVASPALNRLIPRIESLRPGASVELSQVGLLGAILGVLAITAFVVLLFRNKVSEPRLWFLAVFATSATLLFVSGGFGNLQAGLLHFLGTDSPARVWARLIILLAVIGAGVLVLGVEKTLFSDRNRLLQARPRLLKVSGTVLLPLAIIGLIVPDYIETRNPRAPIPFSELEEYPAVEFLASREVQECPILQLPVESMPLPLVMQREHWADTYYRGLIPYIMKPDMLWSFGDYQRINRAPYLDVLGSDMGAPAVGAIDDAGFCYVLFDKRISEISQMHNLGLPGTELGDTFGEAIFSSERFDVYEVSTDYMSSLVTLSIDGSIDFSSGGNSARFAFGSLWGQEEIHTWAGVGDVTILFALNPVPARDVVAVFSGWSFLPPGDVANRVTVSVGGAVIEDLEVDGVSAEYEFVIPAAYFSDSPLALTFSFETSTKPCEVSKVPDCRDLSVAFQTLTFH